jgi:membrane-bound inhibitor of C-type lysozyme
MILPSVPIRHAAVLLCMVALTACENPQKKKEEEAAKNTFACQYNGERLVIRFADGEARMLMPDAERVTLYQLPSASGVRFSNGTLELRGKGMELQLLRDGVSTTLQECAPYGTPPAK